MKASVIVPSFNACERLYYNLLSLNMQSCDREAFEVIVVDDGSKDNTRSMLLNFNSNFRLRTILLKENKGRSNARNCAIEEAKGDILIFHDSDMVAEKDYISKHIAAHKELGTVVSGANWRRICTYYYEDLAVSSKECLRKQLDGMKADIQPIHLQPIVGEQAILNGKCFEDASFQSNAQCMEDVILQSYGSSLKGFFFPWIFFITNNCSAFRSDISKAGSFDNAFLTWGCEDLDLGYRLYRNNCRFFKRDDIISLHQEHPIRNHQNVSENIYLFTSKYNSIDLLLFYYGSHANISKYQANTVLQELEEIKEDENYIWFVNLYRRLLINLRDSICSAGKDKNIQEKKEIKQIIFSGIEELHSVFHSLQKEKKLFAVLTTFKSLLKKALGPSFKSLNID